MAEKFPLEVIEAFESVCEAGSKKYIPGSWKNESLLHHLGKVLSHISKYLCGVQDDEDHILYMFTRATMACYVYLKRN